MSFKLDFLLGFIHSAKETRFLYTLSDSYNPEEILDDPKKYQALRKAASGSCGTLSFHMGEIVYCLLHPIYAITPNKEDTAEVLRKVQNIKIKRLEKISKPL